MRFPAALALLIVASCGAATTKRDHVALRRTNGVDRQITGVLTLYTEGESFHECLLDKPWNCSFSKEPQCGFSATPDADIAINGAIEEAGASQGFATFGVRMIGKRIYEVTSGHLGGYDCRFYATAALSIEEVESTPPEE